MFKALKTGKKLQNVLDSSGLRFWPLLRLRWTQKPEATPRPCCAVLIPAPLLGLEILRELTCMTIWPQLGQHATPPDRNFKHKGETGLIALI